MVDLDSIERPFIARFRTAAKFYVYDVNTNAVLKVDPSVWEILAAVGETKTDGILQLLAEKYSEQDFAQALETIQRLQEESYAFSSNRPKGIRFSLSYAELAEQFKRELNQLILNVTEACNLRCRYCVFSGSYHFQRTHAPRLMDFEVARKAVDLYLNCCDETEFPAITFYGGEPLLNFKLIRQVIEYVRQNYHREVSFNLTTNGLLLKGEAADFLAQNKIPILVSLDGPEEIQDSMRIKADGSGSYSSVMTNLRALLEKYPEYVRYFVNFSVTLADSGNLVQAHEFFTNGDPLFQEAAFTITGVDPFQSSLPEEGVINANDGRTIDKLAQKYVATLIAKQQPDAFLSSLFDNAMRRIHRRSLTPMKEYEHMNGACSPGIRRLFCTVDGDFSLCERVSSGFNIGNVNDGPDPGAACRLAQEYARVSSSKCSQCWAVRFCSICFTRTTHTSEGLKKDSQPCEAERAYWLYMLSIYATLLENRPDALERKGKSLAERA